jgi:hypothetical protein
MRKKLQRLLWVAPVAMLLFAGAASAQTTGTIVGVVNDAATGKPVAGALVIATSKSLQGEQTAVTDGRGSYTLSALPPGVYKLVAQLQGYKPAERTDLNLRVDFTLRANIAMVPEAVQMEEQVVRTGTAPAVNIGSAEAGTIVTREFLANVPTTRTFEQVATIAPTAQRDILGVSFAGATSPENSYIIDGLRVSTPGTGTLGTNILTNFVDQLDVKVGSFMPEYGYSMAGIINTVTKSGGNEFHGSVWGNITPGFFTPASRATWSNGYGVATQLTPYKGSYDTDFGIELGGPIVKDKLWFYAGFAPRYAATAVTGFYQSRVPCTTSTGGFTCVSGYLRDQYNQYVMEPVANSSNVFSYGANKYYALGKLTWLASENHNMSAAFNTQPTSDWGRIGYNGSVSATRQDDSFNTTNVTLNYTGKFADKHLLLEAKAGWFNSDFKINGGTAANGVDVLNTPQIQWRTNSIQAISQFDPTFTCPYTNPTACMAANYLTGGYGYVEPTTNNRYAGSVSLTGLFDLAGQHQLKGGAQIEYGTYESSRFYSGGAFFRAYGNSTAQTTQGSTPGVGNSFYISRSFNTATQQFGPNRYATTCASIDGNGVCVNEGIKDPTNPGKNINTTGTWTNGFFLQDSWTIANVLTLNFGVRWDLQNMSGWGPYGVADAQSISINDEWSPRVQAIWDFTGNGRGKISANWGMYYESIPLRVALRTFNGEPQATGTYMMGTCTGSINPSTNPGINPYVQCPDVYGLAAGTGPGPNVTNLLGVGSPIDGGRGFAITSANYSPIAPDLKGAYTQQFGGGVQYEILQDLTLGVDYIGRRVGNVIEDMSSDDGVNYYIANPTVSKPWTATSGPYAGVTFNASNAAAVDPTTETIFTVPWAAPERSYDAVSITLNKLFSKKWLAQASYTWSSLRGNYPGLFRTENGQLDPNITSEYDLASLFGNKQGPLNLNRTHQIKAAGSYNATLSPDVTLIPSVNFSAMSGLPVSATGNHALYGPTESYILPRGMVGNLDWTYQLDAGLKLLWAISGPYTLQFSLDIFNLLNMATVQWVDMNYTLNDFLTPMQGAQCANKNSYAPNKDVLTALNQNCPDLPYARTLDGRRVTQNLNFGQPQAGSYPAYQSPISARFGVQLSF